MMLAPRSQLCKDELLYGDHVVLQQFAVVNSRFDLGFPPPIGPGAPPGTDFDVVQLRVR